jgi:LmbE family N-acetylglucosaminyl deacetylase
MATGNDDQWTDEDRGRWSTYVIDWLRARRLTQAQAADILGLSGGALTQWCKHGDRPSLTNAEAFGERIGESAAEARAMARYAPASDAEPAVTLEEVMRAVREQNETIKQLQELILNAPADHPLLTRVRKEATTEAMATRRRARTSDPDAPPL